MKYNIKVGERWLIGESATGTIKGTVRGDTTAVFSRMVGEMSAYDFSEHRKEAASFDRITLCDYLRGIVERQNYGHYLGEIKIIPEDREEVETQLPKRGKWIRIDKHTVQCSICHRYLDLHGVNAGRGDANYCPNCGADMREMEVSDESISKFADGEWWKEAWAQLSTFCSRRNNARHNQPKSRR